MLAFDERFESPTVNETIQPPFLTTVGFLMPSLVVWTAVVRVKMMKHFDGDVPFGHCGAEMGVAVWPSWTILAAAEPGTRAKNAAAIAAVTSEKGFIILIQHQIKAAVAQAPGADPRGPDLSS